MASPDLVSEGRAMALTTRLVLGYMLVALLTLSSASFFLHARMRHGFEVEDAEMLSDHVHSLNHEMESHPGDLREARELIGGTAANRSLEKYYGRLHDEKGQVLAETEGYAALAPPSVDFPIPVAVNRDIKAVTRARSASGVPLFVVSAWVSAGPGQPPCLYHLILDITQVDEWLAEFRIQLIIVVAAGTLMSGVLAWFLTQNALKPLQEITTRMQGVVASGLDERLEHTRWPQELAAMAGEFDLMLERLHDAFQRLTQFSADAAHEFRTPLNNLMLSTSFMLSRDHESEEYRQALTANFEEFGRLKRMVDSLLFLARADNAEAVLSKARVDAAMLASEVVDFFSALAEERGVSLSCDGQGEVYADKTLLRMALANLVSNAIRHTQQGGRVTLSVASNGDVCPITVSDTGTGIAARHLPQLFDRFYRVDAARTSDATESGTGLGLALVKTVATLHGGNVSVTSEEQVGTAMCLVLPAEEQKL